MDPIHATIILIAKQPISGDVKTRLCPPLTFDQAADLATSALLDTADVISASNFESKVLYFKGDPKEWESQFTQVIPQRNGNLAQRLEYVFGEVDQNKPACVIAMDTPQVTLEQLTSFDSTKYDSCIGMTNDGGYWIIGFKDPSQAAKAFVDVPMSTNQTGAIQLERLRELGHEVQILDTLTDCDDFETAEQINEQFEESNYGRCFKQIKDTL